VRGGDSLGKILFREKPRGSISGIEEEELVCHEHVHHRSTGSTVTSKLSGISADEEYERHFCHSRAGLTKVEGGHQCDRIREGREVRSAASRASSSSSDVGGNARNSTLDDASALTSGLCTRGVLRNDLAGSGRYRATTTMTHVQRLGINCPRLSDRGELLSQNRRRRATRSSRCGFRQLLVAEETHREEDVS